jgi:oxygen-independent coproporphyrinogen-3 oxidase
MKQIALYIHIPFCLKKCHYCDFNSYTSLELIPKYLDALKREICLYGNMGYSLKTIYIGGGTPTVLGEDQLQKLIDSVYASFDVMDGAEFTVEANPGTLTREKLIILKSMCVNRLSIGLQAYQDKLLKVMGRAHTVSDFEANYDIARESGFDNINVDVIFGLPFQTIWDFTQTLEQLVKLSPEHISCYSLNIEKGTKFYYMLKNGILHMPSEREERQMYHQGIQLLKQNGFLHYEISNFTKPGRFSRHNMVYWNTEQYLGLGAGAHSYIGTERFYNHYSIGDYVKTALNCNSPIAGRYFVSSDDRQAEYCFMRLRLIDGIDEESFCKRFGHEIGEIYKCQINKLKKQGLIKEENRHIKLTASGLDLANLVFAEFLP